MTQVGMGSWLNDLWTNIRSGTLTQDQVDRIVEENAQQLVKASGGRISIEEARRTVRSDVTKVLIARKADPSQTGIVPPAIFDFDLDLGWSKWLLPVGLGFGALALILIVRD